MSVRQSLVCRDASLPSLAFPSPTFAMYCSKSAILARFRSTPRAVFAAGSQDMHWSLVDRSGENKGKDQLVTPLNPSVDIGLGRDSAFPFTQSRLLQETTFAGIWLSRLKDTAATIVEIPHTSQFNFSFLTGKYAAFVCYKHNR